MKTSSILLKSAFAILFLFIWLGCAPEVELSTDDYYRFKSVKQLAIDKTYQKDFFIGIDTINIPLLAKAYNAQGELVTVPPQAIKFLANGTNIAANAFSTKTEGTYHIIAKLAEARSDTLIVRVLDPSKLSLHLKIDSTQRAAFIADGKSQLDLKVELFHNGAPITLSTQFELFNNNVEIGKEPYKTWKAGMDRFKARGGNLESNQIDVEALSPVKKLLLSKTNNDVNFFGYNISETGFSLKGFDANDHPVELSEDIGLFAGTEEIEITDKFKAAVPGKISFKAKGYKIESNELVLEAKSPVKTIKLSYAKVGNTFWADGVSRITFLLETFDFEGKSIKPTADVKLYQGETLVDYMNGFVTTRSGELKFRAKGYNSESEEITVVSTAPVTYQVTRIPVVFHEVNKTVLTQAKMQSLLDNVSKSFRNKIMNETDPKDPNSADLFIEFYLADRDPSGNLLAVKGLDRVTTTKQSFTGEEPMEEAWNFFWNPDQFLNIWVFPNITGDRSGASWAYFPLATQGFPGIGTYSKGNTPFYTYGVFLNARHLDNEGDVLAHEIGHAFGLAHVFDGDLVTHNGCANGDPDYCNDTPYYDRGAYETKGNSNNWQDGFKRTSCNGESYYATNFMDYYFSLNNSFTFDQRVRARHIISYGLWLPTPANGFNNGRRSAQDGYMKKPANYRYVKPVFCVFPD